VCGDGDGRGGALAAVQAHEIAGARSLS